MLFTEAIHFLGIIGCIESNTAFSAEPGMMEDDSMTLKEDGFHGIIDFFKDSVYTAFVKNGGYREINANNIAREQDDSSEYHISPEEKVVQRILFYYSLAEVIGYLPDFCVSWVKQDIERYHEIDLSGTLSYAERKELHAFVSGLILQMQSY